MRPKKLRLIQQQINRVQPTINAERFFDHSGSFHDGVATPQNAGPLYRMGLDEAAEPYYSQRP
jgi:hypothetical protein